MRIRTPADLGALIRDRRINLRLNQRSLAQKAGVSRQWIIEVEKGKPRAEIGLLLRTVQALGIVLTAEKESSGKPAATPPAIAPPGINIDLIVAAARRKRR